MIIRIKTHDYRKTHNNNNVVTTFQLGKKTMNIDLNGEIRQLK